LFPRTWDEYVRAYDEGSPKAFKNSVQINFWDGLTSVDGYGEILFLDATFYKDPGLEGAFS